jgi:hypothetical protein
LRNDQLDERRKLLASAFVPASLDAGGARHQQRLRYREQMVDTSEKDMAETYLAVFRSIRHCGSAMVGAHPCSECA